MMEVGRNRHKEDDNLYEKHSWGCVNTSYISPNIQLVSSRTGTGRLLHTILTPNTEIHRLLFCNEELMVGDKVGDEQRHSLGGNLVQTMGGATPQHRYKTGSHISRFCNGVRERARSSIEIFPMFLSRSSVVLGVIFLYMIRFVEDVKYRPHCLFCTWTLSCSSTIHWEDHTFSVYSFDSFLTNQCMIYVWIYFWMLDFVPLICIFSISPVRSPKQL